MKCPVCASEKLSEETAATSSHTYARFPQWESGLLQYKDLTVGAERARVCLGCGYLMFFGGGDELEKLRRGRPA